METIYIILASILTIEILLIGIVLFSIRKELISGINQIFFSEKIKKLLWASMTGTTKEEIKYEHETPRGESILILLNLLKRNEQRFVADINKKELIVVVDTYTPHCKSILAKCHKTIPNNIISLYEPMRFEGLNNPIHFEPSAIIGIIEELLKKKN
jgi:hypothetical protein